MTEPIGTLGVLHVGEMGAALGALLRARGMRVVTTLSGRSERTAARCREAHIEVLDSLADLVRASAVVLSVVPPAAAEETAESYCDLAARAPAGAIYVDMNSIGPELASSLAGRFHRLGRSFVDASIHGQAAHLATDATLYLSGEPAGRIAELFGDAMRVRVLGYDAGAASMMKMLLGALSKSMSAIFLEVAMLAGRRDMLTEFMQESSEFYPGFVGPVRRMLPTYPQHVSRRVTEMQAIEQTAHNSAQRPCIVERVRELLEEFATLRSATPGSSAASSVESLVEDMMGQGLLASSRSMKQPRSATTAAQ